MTVIHRTDLESTAPKLLLAVLQGPRSSAVLRSWARQDQKIVDAAAEVRRYCNIEDGFGVILDNIGTIVVQGRRGLDDDDYRRILRAKIRANRSRGRPVDVLEVTSLFLDGSVTNTTFTFRDLPPASIVVEGGFDFDPSPLRDLLRITKALGVRLDIVASYTLNRPGLIAGWDADPTIGDGEQGAGWDADAAIGGGAAWALW